MSAYVDEAVTLGMDMVLDAVSGSTWQDGTGNSLDATITGGVSATGPGDGPAGTVISRSPGMDIRKVCAW